MSQRHLHLDFETFSQADIREVGAYRYANDPSTEILCAAMAINSAPPVLWHAALGTRELDALGEHFDALEDHDTLIYAHNAQFEYAICNALLQKTWGIRCPALERFRCTMSLARRAALPGKLEVLALTLGLPQQKDARGKTLIRKFSMMQPAKKPTKAHPAGLPPRRILPADEPEAFAELLEYCAQDVRVEQKVAERLAFFDEPINNAGYTLHERINARGVTVNLAALRHAQKLIEDETEIVSAKFRELTGFEVTRNARLLAWANKGSGTGAFAKFDNLQAETVDKFLDACEGVPSGKDELVDALRMKQSIAYVSIKKIPKMLECAGPHDNRIRGMLNHHGATTGRSTNSLVQFQNMKRPTIPNSEQAYRDIRTGISREMLELSYGPVLEVVSSCVRHFVHDEPRSLLDADYAAIEARIVCWLAGQEDALQEYRAQDAAQTKAEKERLDRYRIMASGIFGISLSDVLKFPHRFVGKEAILGCGFGLGGDRFRASCAEKGYVLPTGLEFTTISAWRTKHAKVVKFWTLLDNAAKKAVLNKGQTFKAGEHISFFTKDVGGMLFLFMRLPSGRLLAYPQPKIVPGKFEGSTAVSFYTNIKGTTWGHMSVWGGVWAENATQAVAADIMCNGAQNAENAGYQIASLIHDQALAYHGDGQTADEFSALLTKLPAWAKGLPIEAEGGVVPFYRKE